MRAGLRFRGPPVNAGRLAELLGLFAEQNPDVELHNVTVVEFAGWCRRTGYVQTRKIPPAWNGQKRDHARMVNANSAEKD